METKYKKTKIKKIKKQKKIIKYEKSYNTSPSTFLTPFKISVNKVDVWTCPNIETSKKLPRKCNTHEYEKE
jgi:hypothetical protein